MCTCMIIFIIMDAYHELVSAINIHFLEYKLTPGYMSALTR